jgi:uncharacterized protein (DUF2147 family)
MLFTSCTLRIIFFLFMLLLLASTLLAAADQASPVGLWKTFDDRTHKPRGTILIYEENGIYSGRIESSFNPAEWTEHCDKCAGDRKDASVIGLVIMRGMTKHGAEFNGGDILDPETGSIYRCRFELSSDGTKLMVRGYLGLSLFGRTQTWTRMDASASVPHSVTDGHSVASIGAESTKWNDSRRQ